MLKSLSTELQRSFSPHPFYLLLILEWILIALTAYKIFFLNGILQPLFLHGQLSIPADRAFTSPASQTVLVVLVLFGLMGLRLPTKSWAKRTYVSISVFLMGAIAIQSWSIDGLSPLLVVMLMRSCLFLEKKKRWWMGGILWLIYPLSLAPFLLLIFVLQPAFINQWQIDPSHTWLQITPAGGFNLTFTPEQVQQFAFLLQKLVVYFFCDGLLSFGIILIVVLLLVNSLVNERQGRRRLAAAHEQLYQYSLQIEDQATLEERNRIAREIHDSLGHLLTTQTVLLQNVELSLKSNLDDTTTFLAQSRQIGSQALAELRQSIALLRADPLQGKTLEEAIAQRAHQLFQVSGIQPDLNVKISTVLPHRLQVVVYRVVEESLTNIYKHSQATQVAIALGLASRNDNSSALSTALSINLDSIVTHSCCLILKIEDNGVGFHIEQNATGFGLRGMQERALSLGGQLHITSQPGAGCQVLLILPLPQITV
jgi:signal transduction histidine kinase